MSESHAPQFEHNTHSLPNQSFGSWIKTQTALYISQILSFISFLSFIGGAIYYTAVNAEKMGKSYELEFIQFLIYVAHLIILAIFIGWLIGMPENENENFEKIKYTYKRIFNRNPPSSKKLEASTKEQLRKFKTYFFWFWIGMYCLYAIFTVSYYFKDKSVSNKNKNVPITQKSDANSENLNKSDTTTNNNQETQPSLENSNTEVKDEKIKIKTIDEKNIKPIKEYISPFLQVAFNNLGSVFIYACFIVLFLPSIKHNTEVIQKLSVFFFSAIVLLFTLSFWVILAIRKTENTDYYEYIIVFEAISGVINAVVLALLIGRLDSKIVGLPSYLISVLYVYSAVQPLFVVFEQPEVISQAIKTFVLIFVFIFKIYFFLIITYALQTGRLLNYLFCFPALSEGINAVWSNQWKIIISRKEDNFSFLIYRKNELIYQSDLKFSEKAECVNKIRELQRIIKNENAIEINPDENFCLRVKDKNKLDICYSNAPKTRKEAERLKRESIENIPYYKPL